MVWQRCTANKIVVSSLSITNLAKGKCLFRNQDFKGIIPICMHFNGIVDEGYWNKLEEYISEHSEAMFSDGICDRCLDEKKHPTNLRKSPDQHCLSGKLVDDWYHLLYLLPSHQVDKPDKASVTTYSIKPRHAPCKVCPSQHSNQRKCQINTCRYLIRSAVLERQSNKWLTALNYRQRYKTPVEPDE